MTGRRGLVLIIVLVVIVFLSLGAYTFTDLMITYQESAQLTGQRLQARYLVDSGVEYVKMFLAQGEDARTEAGGVFDNPDAFRCKTVIAEQSPSERGSFAVIAPSLDEMDELSGTRHGLEDESTRLNLNILPKLEETLPGAGVTLLMALPGMTEDVADAILDWLDEDDEERELGAESGYYAGMRPAYAAKNGPLETVEELLLVRGVSPELLFGGDVNRNGTIDAHETPPEETSGLGWSAYLTLYSMENNVRADGEPRIDLNQSDLQKLSDQLTEVLPPEWVTFILAYRLAGPYTGSNEGEQGLTGALDLTQEPRGKIGTVLDLIGAKAQVTFRRGYGTGDHRVAHPGRFDLHGAGPSAPHGKSHRQPGQNHPRTNQHQPGHRHGPGRHSDDHAGGRRGDPQRAELRSGRKPAQPPPRDVAAGGRDRAPGPDEAAHAVRERRRGRLSGAGGGVFPGGRGVEPRGGRFSRCEPQAHGMARRQSPRAHRRRQPPTDRSLPSPDSSPEGRRVSTDSPRPIDRRTRELERPGKAHARDRGTRPQLP